jgi:hypothetical protein
MVGFDVAIVLYFLAEYTTSHRLGERLEILNIDFSLYGTEQVEVSLN